jgi:hypothetical protein
MLSLSIPIVEHSNKYTSKCRLSAHFGGDRYKDDESDPYPRMTRLMTDLINKFISVQFGSKKQKARKNCIPSSPSEFKSI